MSKSLPKKDPDNRPVWLWSDADDIDDISFEASAGLRLWNIDTDEKVVRNAANDAWDLTTDSFTTHDISSYFYVGASSEGDADAFLKTKGRKNRRLNKLDIESRPDPDTEIFPEVIFDTVFIDNNLTAQEKLVNQTLLAQVENVSGAAYTFEVFNSQILGGTPVITKSGTITGGSIVAKSITPAEMALITNINCYVRFSIPSEEVEVLVYFTNDQGQAPDVPVLENETYNTITPTIRFSAATRAGDFVIATLNGATYSPIEVDRSGSVQSEYFFIANNPAGVMADGNSYTLQVTIIGADSQSVSSTATVTIALADTSEIKLLTPSQDFESDGDIVVVSWLNSNPIPHGVYVGFGTPEQIAAKNFESNFVDSTLSSSIALRGVPSDGSVYQIEIVPVYNDGLGEPVFTNLKPILLNGRGIPQPFISAPAENTRIPDPSTVSWSVLGSAAADFYNVKLLSDFDSSAQYVIEEYSGVTAASQAFTSLPNDGSSAYFSIEAVTGPVVTKDIVHFVSGDTGGISAPTILTPTQLSDVPGTGMDISWQMNGTVASKFWVHVGTAPGLEDIFSSGEILGGSTTSYTIPQGELPSDDSVIHIKLSYKLVSTGKWSDVKFCVTNGFSTSEVRPNLSSPAASTVIQGASLTANWSDTAFAADNFRIRVGSTEGGTEFENHTGIPTTQLSQAIAGYGGSDTPVHITLSSFTGGVERVHSHRQLDYKVEVVGEPGSHGLYNGVGIKTSVAGFTTINDLFTRKDRDGETYENLIIRPPIGNAERDGNKGFGAMTLSNCTNCTIRNVVIIAPPTWYRNIRYFWKKNPHLRSKYGISSGLDHDYGHEGHGLHIKGGHSNTIENVNIIGGFYGAKIERSHGTQINGLIIHGGFSGNLFTTGCGPQGSRPIHYQNVSVISRHDAMRAYNETATDNINFFNSIKGSVQTICENFYVHGGHGRTGSGAIVDGWDKFGAGGGVTYRNGVVLESGLKPIGNAHGGGNNFEGIWCWQGIDSRARHINSHNGGGYCGDFIGNGGKATSGDIGWGNHSMKDIRHHWMGTNGQAIEFDWEKEKADQFVTHSAGFNNYKNRNNISDKHGKYVTPCVSRAQCRARALDLTKTIKAFDVPEAYTMDWANEGL